MKLENIDYRKEIQRIGHILMVNKVIVTSIVMLTVGVLVLQRINGLTDPEVHESHLQDQLDSLDEVTFDEDAIKQITDLNDAKINITSDFTDRDNPFVD